MSDLSSPRPASAHHQTLLLVLAGGAVMGLALGIRHVQGLFLLPITLERGGSRESFAAALALQNLCWGLSQPLAGIVADRHGTRHVVIAGLLLYALGLVGMTVASSPAAFLLSAGVCIGLGLSGTGFGAVYGGISKLVAPAQRGGALGLAGAIGGLVQFAAVPLAQDLLDHSGWRRALVTLALLLVLATPLAWPLRHPQAPSRPPLPADGLRRTLRAALTHRGFWLLNLGFLACGFQLAFIATHLPAYLRDRGTLPTHAVTALALIALANVPGTYCFGVWGGARRRKHLLVALYLARTAAMALFVWLPVSPAGLYGFAAAMGFLWLGTVPLTNGIVAQVFGERYLSTLFGIVFLGHQVGSCLGVWLAGWMFERTGTYDDLWFIAMALGVMAALLHALIDDRRVQP